MKKKQNSSAVIVRIFFARRSMSFSELASQERAKICPQKLSKTRVKRMGLAGQLSLVLRSSSRGCSSGHFEKLYRVGKKRAKKKSRFGELSKKTLFVERYLSRSILDLANARKTKYISVPRAVFVKSKIRRANGKKNKLQGRAKAKPWRQLSE